MQDRELGVVAVVAGNTGSGVFGVEDGVGDQLPHVLVVEAVKDRGALASGTDQTRHAQFRQVLGHRRGGLPDVTGEVADRHLTAAQRPQHLHPRGIGEHAEDLDDQVDLVIGQPPSASTFICMHTQIVERPLVVSQPPDTPSGIMEEPDDVPNQGADMSYALSTTVHTTFADAVERTRHALAEQGFGVLTEIDMKATLKAKLGEDMEDYLILGACNPPLAHRAVEAERQIGLLLPCNVVVRTDPSQQGAVIVDAMDPKVMVQVSENPELRQVADEAARKLGSAIASLGSDAD